MYAESVDIIFHTTSGEMEIQKVDKNRKKWGFFDGEIRSGRISKVENINLLTELEYFEMYNLSDLEDYSFLAELPKLKSLHMAGCTVKDLHFIEGLRGLKYLYLNIYFDKMDVQFEKYFDLVELKSIEFILWSDNKRQTKIPNFINVQNKPFIDLANNNIETVSEEEMHLLGQYSLIDMKFNPIAEDKKEQSRLKDLNVRFDPREPLPEGILKFYQQGGL